VKRKNVESLQDRFTAALRPNAIWKRLESYPKWIREYIHNVDTFVGAEEVQELTYLRDQNKALIRLVAELKATNRRLHRQIAGHVRRNRS
jgi:hypothetical protein